VSGIIDKVEYDENGNPTIIDYKSGAIDEKKLAVIKPGQAGGDYRRQLWFYKLLFEGYRANGPKVKAGKIAYLQANAEGQFPQRTIEFEHSEEELIKELIKDTYQKIMNLSFDTGCGKPDCKWCNFVKNSTIDTFAEEDLLDD
jgi:DNA helicase-2/ATP-dependent DNA helicase PcrA